MWTMAPTAKAYMPGLRAGSLKRYILKMENEEEALILAASLPPPLHCPSFVQIRQPPCTLTLKLPRGLLLAPAGEEGTLGSQ